MTLPPDRMIEIAANLIAGAGGRLVGRTRLQKLAYILDAAGYGNELEFEYHHFGPYSQQLADAVQFAVAANRVKEEDQRTQTGNAYSVFTTESKSTAQDREISAIYDLVKSANAVELELAATALFLALDRPGIDPWIETSRHKPEKSADGRLTGAKELYRKLQDLPTRTRLPKLV